MESGRNVTQLLVRNFLKAVGVWWFPPMVLQVQPYMIYASNLPNCSLHRVFCDAALSHLRLDVHLSWCISQLNV